MQSKSFLKMPMPETYSTLDIPYTEKKESWVTPAIEAFHEEWKKTEFFKRYGSQSIDS